jgi:hypothetical protein
MGQEVEERRKLRLSNLTQFKKEVGMSDYPFPNRISDTSGLRQVNPIGGNMAAGMVGSRCENPVKESDVSTALNTLHSSVEQLEGRIQLLATRLNPVLMSKPKCAEEKKDGELSQCGLAKAIRTASQRIDKIQNMVNDLVEDLEI